MVHTQIERGEQIGPADQHDVMGGWFSSGLSGAECGFR